MRGKIAIVLAFDAFLQLEHHRTGGVDDFNIVSLGQFIGLRRFTMSAQKDLHIVQLPHLIVLDGDQSHLAQPVTLHAVMHNVAQTIEFIAFGEFFFGLSDGGCHTETETTATIYLYHHIMIS